MIPKASPPFCDKRRCSYIGVSIDAYSLSDQYPKPLTPCYISRFQWHDFPCCRFWCELIRDLTAFSSKQELVEEIGRLTAHSPKRETWNEGTTFLLQSCTAIMLSGQGNKKRWGFDMLLKSWHFQELWYWIAARPFIIAQPNILGSPRCWATVGETLPLFCFFHGTLLCSNGCILH